VAEIAVSGADLDLAEIALATGLVLGAAEPGTLTDPERTPIAERAADGSLTALQPLAPRPELPTEGVVPFSDPGVRRAAAAVVFDALPTRSQTAVVDALPGGAVAWIALTGRGRSGTAAGPLLGAVRAAATAWSARTGRAVVVAALPWAIGAGPAVLPLPVELDGAEALAGWIARTLGPGEVVVLGESDEHRALAALEDDAAGAARALFSAEVLPFHRGEHGGGTVLLLTGLSGSGKSTIARAVAARLTADGDVVSVLDGDEVRQLLSSGLGFDAEGRATNIRRIGWVAAQIARAGGTAIAAPIAPFADGRAELRRTVEAVGARFVLVHVSTPLEVCEARDRKGLYAAARAGRIADFTGISSPYEPPSDADVTIDTSLTAVDDAARAVLDVVRGGAR
jgi:sulfate adenylyltransferase